MIHPSVVCVLAAALATTVAPAQPVIYATGQILIPGDPDLPSTDPGHYDTIESYVYAIDLHSGLATPVSPDVTTGLPSALAAAPSGELFGFVSGFASGLAFGQVVQMDSVSGSQTNIGPDIGLRSSAFDIISDGRGFILPFDPDDNTQQIHALDLSNGSSTPIGSARAIGDAIDLARGSSLGSAEPFIISLGSVGSMLYGVELDTASLVSIDSTSGAVSVVGMIGAVGMANGGSYSGFSALTGVDEDSDGEFDALIGSVNQFNDGTGSARVGGIARFDLATGEWSLIGTNPGIVFFGFGSSPAQAGGCNAADVAEPFGTLDLFDLSTFLTLFSGNNPDADLAAPIGTFDFFDISAYLGFFGSGCP
jgi:hypothetical protein